MRLGGQDLRYAAVRHVERTLKAPRPAVRAVLVAEARRRGHREPHGAESQTVGADRKGSAPTVAVVSYSRSWKGSGLKLPLPRSPLMSWVFMAYCSTEWATASELTSRALRLMLSNVSQARW